MDWQKRDIPEFCSADRVLSHLENHVIEKSAPCRDHSRRRLSFFQPWWNFHSPFLWPMTCEISFVAMGQRHQSQLQACSSQWRFSVPVCETLSTPDVNYCMLKFSPAPLHVAVDNCSTRMFLFVWLKINVIQDFGLITHWLVCIVFDKNKSSFNFIVEIYVYVTEKITVQ